MGYVDQTWNRISLIVDFTLTDAASAVIKYWKPSGASGQWTAVIATPLSLQKIYYDLTLANEIDEEGQWAFQAFVTHTDGRTAPGDVVYHNFKAQGI
jgi:hypothetical protein